MLHQRCRVSAKVVRLQFLSQLLRLAHGLAGRVVAGCHPLHRSHTIKLILVNLQFLFDIVKFLDFRDFIRSIC